MAWFFSLMATLKAWILAHLTWEYAGAWWHAFGLTIFVALVVAYLAERKLEGPNGAKIGLLGRFGLNSLFWTAFAVALASLGLLQAVAGYSLAGQLDAPGRTPLLDLWEYSALAVPASGIIALIGAAISYKKDADSVPYLIGRGMVWVFGVAFILAALALIGASAWQYGAFLAS